MRLSELLTTRSPERDGASDLLVRAGYTHRLGDGLYTLLPLARRVLANIEAIFRREMARRGIQEVTMPLLQPAAPWDRRAGSGETRAEAFGPQLFRLAEGMGEPLILSPTHEEVAALVGSACIGDVRDLPRVVYQIQPRFRNQTCPPDHGLLHTREFVMADAYGFHADRASLDGTYLALRAAFSAIVSACGASARWVTADGGAIGGDESEELVAPIPGATGTAAVFCDGCGYAASAEIAEFARPQTSPSALAPMTEVAADDAPDANRLVWVPFVAGTEVVLGVIPRGSLLSPVKLAAALSRANLLRTELHPATARELGELGLTYDSISLVRTPRTIAIVADEALRSGANFTIPSARPGCLLTDVNPTRDFRVDLFADICSADEGAPCVRCGAILRAERGVEVGHIFKLGARYLPIEMTCYGLGLTRLMATVVEQRRDAAGIVWPESIAPFRAAVVPETPTASPAALRLYESLSTSGIDLLLDDSLASLAEKTEHLDLLGIPLQLVISGELDAVRLRERTPSSVQEMRATDVGPALLARAAASGRARTL
jgi:prolyl-tRNA synthetase